MKQYNVDGGYIRLTLVTSCRTQGIISAGGVQWMTAGRGIIHSEMPAPTDDKLMHGFQLWINLPAKDKMVKPRCV